MRRYIAIVIGVILACIALEYGANLEMAWYWWVIFSFGLGFAIGGDV